MRRLLLISLAACVILTTSILSALAMPVAKPNMLAGSDGIVLVKGGHGHGTGIMRGAAVAAITTVGTNTADIITGGTGADIADGIRNIRQGRPKTGRP